jgi:hypothetical protein
MRRVAVALLLVSVASLAARDTDNCPTSGKVLDEQFGFRDLKFDTAVRKVANLEPVPQELFKTKRVSAYVRTTDSLEIFEQELGAITYYFFDGRLFLVQLQWSPRGDPIKVLQGFRDALGCEFQKSDGPAGQDLFLAATGQRVRFYGLVHVSRGKGVYGGVFLQRIGVQQAIDEAIKKEAAAHFE